MPLSNSLPQTVEPLKVEKSKVEKSKVEDPRVATLIPGSRKPLGSQDTESQQTGGRADSVPLSNRTLGSSPSVRFRAAKVFLALPAYNEQESLPELLERVGEAFADSGLEYEVIIVDDGSHDDTSKIASQMSFQMPIYLVRHRVNQGLGITIRDALREAADRAGERDIIVTMDADNTHPPGLIDRMVGSVHEGCDCVIASRFQNGSRVIGVPIERHFLSVAARILFTILFPTRGVRDYTSGYRAYRASMIRDGFDRYGDRFISETGFSCMADLLLNLRKMGCVFGEAPLLLRYDQKGGASKMQVFKTIWLTLKMLGRHRIKGS